MRRWKIGIVIVAVSAACWGCEDPVEEDVDLEPPERFVEISPMPRTSETPEEDKAEAAPPSVEFAIWPGGGDLTASQMTWLGGEERIALYAEPNRDTEVVGQAQWDDGSELNWTESVVRVDKPKTYRVEDAVTMYATPYDVAFRELEADEFELELAPGDEVFLYQYGGDGTCYLGVDDEIVLTDCPGDKFRAIEADDEPGENEFAPHSEEWWIKVESDAGTGWMRVDDGPVEVHSRKSEGYEDVEPVEEFDGTEHREHFER